MADPFARLRRLADTSDLATLDDEALGARGKALTDALAALPQIHADLRAARQAVGVELHHKRGRSLRYVAEKFGRSPTRVTQILRGENGRKSAGGSPDQD
jgi:hypothetical protein